MVVLQPGAIARQEIIMHATAWAYKLVLTHAWVCSRQWSKCLQTYSLSESSYRAIGLTNLRDFDDYVGDGWFVLRKTLRNGP